MAVHWTRSRRGLFLCSLNGLAGIRFGSRYPPKNRDEAPEPLKREMRHSIL